MKFEDLQRADVLPAVIEDISKGRAAIKGGKIVYDFNQLNTDTPWYLHGKEDERECNKWHKIYFDKFHVLPRGCMHCWKIVCRPKNLDALFDLNKLQEKMNLFSKCGVDLRLSETYKGIYLGFWYGPLGDLEGTKELYKEVKREVRGALSLDTPVILKRGCTEMENAFGPSHLWTYTPENRLMESLLETVIKVEELREEQTGFMHTHTMAFWILYAHRRGDPTAKKYIRNYPLSVGSVPTSTYHDVMPEIKEEVIPYEIEVQRLQEN